MGQTHTVLILLIYYFNLFNVFFLDKLFKDANQKYLKKIQPELEKINNLESQFKSFSNEELKQKTKEFQERLKKGATMDDILAEAFATVRETAKRCLNQRHYDVQVIGGIALHQGKIAEMKTGEGKTLASTLPVYLNALEGKGAHIITVNDYLTERDTVWMGQIFDFLGLSVGCIVHNQAFIYDANHIQDAKAEEQERDEQRDILGGFKVFKDYLRPVERKQAYLADITYGTNNEFGFDYLRDNMIYDLAQKTQRDFNFAIVDEIDSILIDEARTPLIISMPDTEAGKMYDEFASITPQLKKNEDYEVDEKFKAITLTEKGIRKVEEILKLENIYEEKGIKYLHHLEQAMRAEALFKKDKDYIVKNNQVIIVDEFTGRLMEGRRFSGGLHQALEAKEKVAVQPESRTLASVTFQNYFRLYKKLAGMTGTATTSAEEFDKVYNLEVVIIPTNRPLIRKDIEDKIYKTEQGKFKAVIEEIKQRRLKKQPVLVGTTSIDKNEYLGKLLGIEGIPYELLNAKQHEKEGEIIAQAGRLGQVTIATNMAGRGVDIILGGNPKNAEQEKKVVEVGGLHIIGTERHEARRIDNQLRGRAGRQGDPGSSQFFISLEDDLLRIFGGDRIKNIMNKFKIPEDQPIEAKMMSGVIENSQSKIEGMNFDLRKHLLDYDDVLNKHREVIYKKRREILEKSAKQDDLKKWILEIMKNQGHTKEDYNKKEQEITKENMKKIQKIICLRTIDLLFMEHLENMEYLRDSVRLRAYGQRDPLVEYKREGHTMFQTLISTIETNIVSALLKISVKQKPETQSEQIQFSAPSTTASKNVSQSKQKFSAKIGRNDPCPCGSGKKYKKCCLLKQE
ncbi:MAG: preprotein translocase subunit SecA [Patescibacteria group bacterium]|nr:preprotein translocase subunit SecA [Patescibacteria group bacterium]